MQHMPETQTHKIILHSDNQGKTQVVWDACDHIPETQ